MLRFASRAERAVAVPGRPVAPVRELAARDIQQLQLLADAGQVPTRFVDIGRLVIAVADIGLSLGESPAGRLAHVVSAAVDTERRHAGLGELEMVGAIVVALLGLRVRQDLQSLPLSGLLERVVEGGHELAAHRHVTGLAVHVHHVHVQIRDRVREREQRVAGVIGSAQEALLLRRRGDEQHTARRRRPGRGVHRRQLQQARDAGRIIDGAVEDLRIAIGPRPGAEVVPVRAVHHHLLGMARALHERGHVVADDGPHLVVQGQTRGELQGNGFEATPRRRTRELIEAETGGGKELPGGLVAQPALSQRMVGITRRQLLPWSGIAVLHHLPGITRGPSLMHDEHTGCAPARGLLVFISPAAVVGHGLAVKELRVTGGITRIIHQYHHRLALRVETGVVVPLVFGRDDAVAGEHQGTPGERHGRLRARRTHDEVSAEAESERRGAADRERCVGVGGDLHQRHFLQEAAVVGRQKAVALELGGDVFSRELLARTGRRPAAELIRGQSPDGGADIGLVEARGPGCLCRRGAR